MPDIRIQQLEIESAANALCLKNTERRLTSDDYCVKTCTRKSREPFSWPPTKCKYSDGRCAENRVAASYLRIDDLFTLPSLHTQEHSETRLKSALRRNLQYYCYHCWCYCYHSDVEWSFRPLLRCATHPYQREVCWCVCNGNKRLFMQYQFFLGMANLYLAHWWFDPADQRRISAGMCLFETISANKV